MPEAGQSLTLQKFAGRLVHDCWATYFRLKNCQHCLCNPHLIRELVFAQEQLQQQWAAKMKKLLQEAYDYGKVHKKLPDRSGGLPDFN